MLPPVSDRLILSLCDHTGNWPRPYALAGYPVRTVDLKRGEDAWVRCSCCENFWCRIHERHAFECACPPVEEWASDPYSSGMAGEDVRLMRRPEEAVWGILAAPPCTAFANSGARWPRSDADMREALSVVDACLRLVLACRPRWWALENPVGKLSRYLGPPLWRFHPWQFGDPYTKATCLWGDFLPPSPLFTSPRAVMPQRVCAQGSWIQRLGGRGERTKALRSATPPGFARAFFEVNP